MSTTESPQPFTIGRLVYILVALSTAIIGYHIHHSIFWACVDWIFWPIAWFKWLICQEVSMTVIRETFAFFTK
jgi:hypothetical protein